VPRPEDVPRLIGELSDPQLRTGALLALAQIGPAAKDAVPDVVRILDDKNATLERPMAARTLGRIGAGHPLTVPALCRALTAADKDFDVQVMAIEALAGLGPLAKDALPVLDKLTDDDNPVLAEGAEEAMAIIEGRKHVRDGQ
jgi:HEAT repeat protein